MRRAILLGVMVGLMAACGQAATPAASTGTAEAATGSTAATLAARPLKLSPIAAGGACPVTPVTSVSVGVANPRGHGPFYLGGPMPRGAFPWNKTVYGVAGVPGGPLLFRGARLDGAGRLQFSGEPVTATDKGQLLSSDDGVSDTFYDRVLQRNTGGGAFFLYPSTPGCYGLQVDAPAFEDVIVISAS